MQKFKVFCDQKRDFELINQVNYQGPTQPEPVEGFTDENAPPPAQEAVGMFVCAYEDCNFIQIFGDEGGFADDGIDADQLYAMDLDGFWELKKMTKNIV